MKVSLSVTLRRWEDALCQPLPSKVWEDYRQLSDRPLVLNECTECGFGSFLPAVTGTANFYNVVAATDYYNADKWEFACAATDLMEARAKRILDVGCGSGAFLERLRQEIPGATLYGFDLNDEVLGNLEARGFGVLPSELAQCADAMAGKEQFDAITMLQVLEHTEDPVAFIKTFIDLLRPGGMLIITTPNSAGPIRFFPDALTELPPHHVTRWTEKCFHALFSAHGLTVSSVKLEPLPSYLWDAYLPELWDTPIWPAQLFDPIAKQRGLVTVGERSGMAAQAMKQAGIRHLNGVVGHTIYVTGVFGTNK